MALRLRSARSSSSRSSSSSGSRMRSAPRDRAPAQPRHRRCRAVGGPAWRSSSSAILQSSTWGFVLPRNAPDDQRPGDHAAGLLGGAVPDPRRAGRPRRCSRPGRSACERLGRDRLLDLALLRIVHLRAGLSTLADPAAGPPRDVLRAARLPPGRARVRRLRDRPAAVPPVGRDAHRRPVGSTAGRPAVAARGRPARTRGRRARGGHRSWRRSTSSSNALGFGVGLAIFGIGAGLLASQLGNVIISAAPPAQTNEAGGLQGTAQNLGASLGTALIGAVLLLGLTSGFASRSRRTRRSPVETRTAIADKARETGLEVVDR